MGRAHSVAIQIQAPPGVVAPPLRVSVGPQALMNVGHNIRVEVATASAFVNNVTSPAIRNSIQVTAHLDTGAARTTIAASLAAHLGLVEIGKSPIHTANGSALTSNYAIDLLFVGTNLTAKTDLAVSSCTLPFTVAAHNANPHDPKNMGMLIGRDIMAAWLIVWDGPTSTVVISD